MSIIRNELIFGPLDLTGGFSYFIIKECEINNELLHYLHSIDNEIGSPKTKIINLINSSIFTRIIKLNLGYTNPLIGLLTVVVINNCYRITHISIHKSFRRQGLAKMLLTILANSIDPKYELVTSVILENMENGIALFRSLKFNEVIIETDYHMLQTTNLFCNLTHSPIKINTL
jgi:hypothetical protein